MKLGISDKYFYYFGAGDSTFEVRYVMRLRDALNSDRFNEALIKSVDLYPEFKQKIVIKSNRLEREKNELYPVVFKNTDSHKYFTKEVNFYNYFFTYNDKTKELTLNTCHGLTDAFSAIRFLTCVFYHYALISGDKFSEAETDELKKKIRLSPDGTGDLDEALMFDPYSKFYGRYEEPQLRYLCKNPYLLEYPGYDKASDCMNLYEIRLKTPELAETAKSLKTSFTAIFIYCISKSICEKNVTDGKPVVAMMPVDFRRVFDVDTMVNFSDGIIIPFEHNDIYAERESALGKIKTCISKQLTKETMAETMEYKAKLISEAENRIDDIYILFKQFKKILLRYSPKNYTYALSNPGKIDFGRHLNNYFTDVKIYTYMDDCSCIISGYGESLKLMIGLKTDDRSFPEGVNSELKRMGLTAELTDCGKTHVNAIELRDMEKTDD